MKTYVEVIEMLAKNYEEIEHSIQLPIDGQGLVYQADIRMIVFYQWEHDR